MNTELSRSADDWMSLPDQAGVSLFDIAEPERTKLHRRLVTRWHPDRNHHPKAQEVFVRLHAWFAQSHPNRASATIHQQIDHASGKVFEVKYNTISPKEWGRQLRGQHVLAEVFDPLHADLFGFALSAIKSLPFADEKMRKQMSPLLPHVLGAAKDANSATLVLRKDPRAICLADTLAYWALRGKVWEPNQVAWIVSGLWHLACYLEHAKVVHNAITAENVWIIPENHSVHLWGGWEYACGMGEKIKALPGALMSELPTLMKSQPKASASWDHQLINALACQLLGDRSAMGLANNPDIPNPLINSLRRPSSGSAQKRYTHWKKVLADSFGAPRFVVCPLTASNIYPSHSSAS